MPSYQFQGHGVSGAPKKSGFDQNENHSHSESYSRYYQNSHPNLAGQTGITLSPSDQVADSISAGIDWISVSTRLPNREKFERFIADIFGELPIIVIDRAFKIADGVYKDKTIKSQVGVRGGVTIDDQGYHCYLQVPGSWWECKSPLQFIRVVWQLQAYRCSCSRLDLRLDDWSHELIPAGKMVVAAAQGDCAGFKKWGNNFGGNVGEGQKNLVTNFGGRKSEAYTRIYYHDWGQELGQSLRMETEFKGNKAQEVFNLLANWERSSSDRETANQEISDLIISLVTGQMDFINKTKDGTRSPKGINKQDCRRLEWWQDFLDKVGEGLKITVTRRKASWQQKVDWLYRQVSKSLYMLRHTLGFTRYSELMSGMCQSAVERMSDQDYMLMRQLELEKDVIIV